ncbi:UDP-N-acetylmuramate dehydrogenase [Chitinophagaceae bacterium MMS25-I14]
MQIQRNVSLKAYNTFGMDVLAENLLELTDIAQLEEAGNLTKTAKARKILGGGSNVLFTEDLPGLVILNRTKGIDLLREDEQHVWLRVAAGEVWHDLVMYTINNGWSGLENLSLIPGTVGAAPIQNIGAYGVEVKECIESVTGWHWGDKAFEEYTAGECEFDYRDSIFKRQLKDRIMITSVTFRLNKKAVFRTSYGAITEQLDKMGVTELSIKAISDAVIAIRTSKLPDPKKIGNAGSFFKNPSISRRLFEMIETEHPEMPSYPSGKNYIKLPAGWLIEQCGWKGFRKGDAGVHAKQALVLVNYGKATGQEIWALSDDIIYSVQEKFGIELEREVQVW